MQAVPERLTPEEYREAMRYILVQMFGDLERYVFKWRYDPLTDDDMDRVRYSVGKFLGVVEADGVIRDVRLYDFENDMLRADLTEVSTSHELSITCTRLRPRNRKARGKTWFISLEGTHGIDHNIWNVEVPFEGEVYC